MCLNVLGTILGRCLAARGRYVKNFGIFRGVLVGSVAVGRWFQHQFSVHQVLVALFVRDIYLKLELPLIFVKAIVKTIHQKQFKNWPRMRTFFGGSSSMTTVASLRAASSLASSLALVCSSSSSATTCLSFLKKAGSARLNFFFCDLAALPSALSVSLLLDTNTLNGSQLQCAW